MTTTEQITASTERQRRRGHLSTLGEWLGIAGAIANGGMFMEDVPWIAGHDGTDATWSDLAALSAHHHLGGLAGAWFWFAGWLALAVAVVVLVVTRFVPKRGQRAWQALAVGCALGVGAVHVAAAASVRGVGELPSGFGYGFYGAVVGCALLAAGALLPSAGLDDD